MAAGGKRMFLWMQKQLLRDPPNAICDGSARNRDTVVPVAANCRGSRVGCLNENADGTPQKAVGFA